MSKIMKKNSKAYNQLLKDLKEADLSGNVFCFTVREVVEKQFLIGAKDLKMAHKFFNLATDQNQIHFLRTNHGSTKISEDIIKIENKKEFQRNRRIK